MVGGASQGSSFRNALIVVEYHILYPKIPTIKAFALEFEFPLRRGLGHCSQDVQAEGRESRSESTQIFHCQGIIVFRGPTVDDINPALP